MASISVTYTFSNSTTADATQVNQNFTDIINGTSDGTKDFSISALTTAGTATLNGNVVLGNGSAKTITPNGSFAGSILFGTLNAYDIASNLVGLRALYLNDSASNARSTKIQGGAIASAWTLTLPTSGGTSGYYLKNSDGAGTTTWGDPGLKTIASKTTTYSATTSDDVILCSSAGGIWTLTLPAASNTGKVLYIKKTDTSTNLITISRAGSDTIDGATSIHLATQYEMWVLVADGSSTWNVIEHKATTPWTTFTMTVGGSTSAPTKGTVSIDNAQWCRRGKEMWIRYDYKQTASGAAGSGDYLYPIPNSWTADTSIVAANTNGLSVVGKACADNSSQAERQGAAVLYNSTNIGIWIYAASTSDSAMASSSLGPVYSSANTMISFFAQVPISNWED